MTDDDQTPNRPIERHRDGSVEIAIWKRESEKGPVFNTQRTRSYQDQEGNWQKTHSIPERDLLKAARLDQRAYESIQQMREQERVLYMQKQTSPQPECDNKGQERKTRRDR